MESSKKHESNDAQTLYMLRNFVGGNKELPIYPNVRRNSSTYKDSEGVGPYEVLSFNFHIRFKSTDGKYYLIPDKLEISFFSEADGLLLRKILETINNFHARVYYCAGRLHNVPESEGVVEDPNQESEEERVDGIMKTLYNT